MAQPATPPPPQQQQQQQQPRPGPGLRGARTTALFRAVNPELFVAPNKAVMALGFTTFSLCVAYIGYLHAQRENKKDLYEAIDGQGDRHTRRKTSKWD